MLVVINFDSFPLNIHTISETSNERISVTSSRLKNVCRYITYRVLLIPPISFFRFGEHINIARPLPNFPVNECEHYPVYWSSKKSRRIFAHVKHKITFFCVGLSEEFIDDIST